MTTDAKEQSLVELFGTMKHPMTQCNDCGMYYCECAEPKPITAAQAIAALMFFGAQYVSEANVYADGGGPVGNRVVCLVLPPHLAAARTADAGAQP